MAEILDGRPPATNPPVGVEGGGDYGCSGGGYVVVQALLADLTGTPFAELAGEVVLEPRGMADGTFEQPLGEAFEARAATGTTEARPSAGAGPSSRSRPPRV